MLILSSPESSFAQSSGNGGGISRFDGQLTFKGTDFSPSLGSSFSITVTYSMILSGGMLSLAWGFMPSGSISGVTGACYCDASAEPNMPDEFRPIALQGMDSQYQPTMMFPVVESTDVNGELWCKYTLRLDPYTGKMWFTIDAYDTYANSIRDVAYTKASAMQPMAAIANVQAQ